MQFHLCNTKHTCYSHRDTTAQVNSVCSDWLSSASHLMSSGKDSFCLVHPKIQQAKLNMWDDSTLLEPGAEWRVGCWGVLNLLCSNSTPTDFIAFQTYVFSPKFCWFYCSVLFDTIPFRGFNVTVKTQTALSRFSSVHLLLTKCRGQEHIKKIFRMKT